MKHLLTFLSLALILSSCVTTNKGFQSSPVISRNVHLDPIKADIQVNEKNKIQGESSSAYFLVFRVQGDNTFADGIVYSADVNDQSSLSTLQQVQQLLNPFYIVRRIQSEIQGARLNQVRGSAAYKALSTGDYDVLVHPNYTTTVEDYLLFKKYSVKVEGYGAKYTNFRTERQKIVILENGKEFTIQDK